MEMMKYDNMRSETTVSLHILVILGTSIFLFIFHTGEERGHIFRNLLATTREEYSGSFTARGGLQKFAKLY